MWESYLKVEGFPLDQLSGSTRTCCTMALGSILHSRAGSRISSGVSLPLWRTRRRSSSSLAFSVRGTVQPLSSGAWQGKWDLPYFGLSGGNGGTNSGGGGGGSGGGGGNEDDNSEPWRNRVCGILVLLAASLLQPASSFAILLGTSTRQTYIGETANKYAQVIEEACRENGHEFYDEPYKLNIIGIRNPSEEAGAFDDHLAILYHTDSSDSKHQGWVVTVYKASVDPGRAWLTLGWGGPGGTAILCPGQYKDAYEVGLHKDQYEALLQRRPVKVWRDYNRDGKLDFGEPNSFDEQGVFGINIHHAGIRDSTEYNQLLTRYTDMVEKYSAGCQVVATVEDFKHFMELVHISSKKGHGPNFTYTLFDGNELWEKISKLFQCEHELLQPVLLKPS